MKEKREVQIVEETKEEEEICESGTNAERRATRVSPCHAFRLLVRSHEAGGGRRGGAREREGPARGDRGSSIN